LVVGSNPSAATKVGILPEVEDLPIRELLEMLLGEEGKRRLRLRRMTNGQLFEAYDAELVCRHRSPKGLYEDRRLLGHFKNFLGEFPPTPELGKQFLGQFAARKTATLARYVATLKAFFDWLGEPLNVRVRLPRTLPPYTEDADVNALLEAIRNKSTHKGTVARDLLLVNLAVNTGLRRKELADLRVGDIHLDQGILVVKGGKGEKDGAVPLTDAVSGMLRGYTRGMAADQRLFGLRPATISGKLAWFSRKAGVNVHAHTLRHVFGTRLVERGANVEAVRQLMRHESLDTTQRYISLSARGLKEAIGLLDREPEPRAGRGMPWGPEGHKMSWERVKPAGSQTRLDN
jgi:integrase